LHMSSSHIALAPYYMVHNLLKVLLGNHIACLSKKLSPIHMNPNEL
jgi:hypothetical protein